MAPVPSVLMLNYSFAANKRRCMLTAGLLAGLTCASCTEGSLALSSRSSPSPDPSTSPDPSPPPNPPMPGTSSPIAPDIPIADGGFRLATEGLFGGTVLDLVRCPSAPETLYASTDGAGLFRTDDDGQTWRATAFSAGSVTDVSIDPADCDRVWGVAHRARQSAAAPLGVYGDRMIATSDGGQSFRVVGLPDGFRPGYVSVSASVVWVEAGPSGSSAMLQSFDGGRHWQVKSTRLGFGNGLLAHASDSRVAWRYSRSALYRTDDGGATFVEFTPDLNRSEGIADLAISPQAPEQLWLSILNGPPRRSDDGGRTWTVLGQGAGSPWILSYRVTPSLSDSSVVWASGRRGSVMLSEDSGHTFVNVATPRATRFRFERSGLVPKNGREALAFGAMDEIHTTIDGAASWQRSVQGLSAVSVRSLAIAPNGARLVVGTDHGDVFVSDDQGRSFSHSRVGLVALAVASIALDPTDPDTIYVGMGQSDHSELDFGGAPSTGLFKSTDGGLSFSRIGAPGRPYYLTRDGVIRVGYDGEVLVRAEQSPAALSEDGGQTWQELTHSDSASFQDLRPGRDDSGTELTGLTVGHPKGVVVSQNYGVSWTELSNDDAGLQFDRLRFAFASRVDPSVYYAKSDVAFVRNAGRGWIRAETGLGTIPGVLPKLLDIGIGRAAGADHIYGVGRSDTVQTTQWSIHVSRDGAASWQSVVLPYMGVPSAVAVAEQLGTFGAIGFGVGRGLLVTRTAGQP